MSHDQLFKQLLQAFFGDLVEIIAPRIAERLDLERASFLDKETFTDTPRGDRNELDLLAEIPSRDGSPEWILVHVEIEGEFREETDQRLWRYYLQLTLRHPDRPILPIVLYLRGGPAGIETRTVEHGLFGFTVSRFTFYAFGLSRADAEPFLAGEWPLGWGLAALMRDARNDPVAHKLACLRPIAHAELDDARRFLLVNAVETYVELNDTERARFQEYLEHELPEVRAMELTWSEQHFTRGLEEGRQMGRREGRRDSLRDVLRRLLERRFGALPETIRQRLEAIDDLDVLDRLTDRALDAESLDDLDL